MSAAPEATTDVPCCVCGAPTPLPAFLRETAKAWMRRAFRDAEATGRMPEALSDAELTPCPTCAPEWKRKRDEQMAVDDEYRRRTLAEIANGIRNPEAIAWLRAFGHGRDIAAAEAAYDAREKAEAAAAARRAQQPVARAPRAKRNPKIVN